MSKKTTLEESVKLALEAAEAANSVAADNEAAAAAVEKAARQMERTTRRATLAGGGAAGLALVACILGGMAFHRAQTDMTHTNETLIEGLAMFAESVDALKTAVETGGAVLSDAADEQSSIAALTARLDDLETVIAARVVEAVEDSANLGPQLARAIIEEIGATEARLQDGVLQRARDLELSFTEMLSAQTDALLNVRPAPERAIEAAPRPPARPAGAGRDEARAGGAKAGGGAGADGTDSVNPFTYP
ncbi:hypothetical protein [Rhodosalinus sp.]|uniref:hypothetical protein n=1 Tax=Rhodosalinus sp. TaxID=2047741 RepID=UPI00397CE8BD